MDKGKDFLDKRLEILGAWSGIAWVIFAAAAYGGSGLVPVLSPSVSPEVLVTFVTDHKYRILIGMLLMFVGGYTFLLTWSMTLAYQIRKYANPSPLAFYAMFAIGINGAVIGMLCGVVGSEMAYRVETLQPATTQALYDLLWFLFLIPWPPFLVWQFITGFAILSGTNTQVMFPRWTGYFCLWAGALEIFSAFSVFWYKGPFSYNGAVSFWVPGASFFIWVIVMASTQIKGWVRVKSPDLTPEGVLESPGDEEPVERDLVRGIGVGSAV